MARTTASGRAARTAAASAVGAGPDVHAQPVGLGGQVAGDVQELGPARHAGGQQHLAPEPALALVEHDPVAALGRRDRGLQSAGPPHDHDPPGRGRSARSPTAAGRPAPAAPTPPAAAAAGPRSARGLHRLPPGPGVLDAAQPPVEPHATDALLVAGQAGADVGAVAGAGLGREVGVGDLAADHPDQVAQPGLQGPIRLQRVLEAAHADHREADGLADGARYEQGVAGRDLHARFDHVQGGRGHPDRRVDVVDLAGGFDQAGHRHGVLDGRAALDELVATQAHAEGGSRPDGLPDGGHQLQQQPGALGKRRRSRRCGGWWPGRGSRARSRNASTAARRRRTRRPCSDRPPGRNRRRSRRSRGARPPWAPPGRADPAPGSAPRPAGGCRGWRPARRCG